MANKPMHDDLALLKKLAFEAGEIGLKYFKSDNQVWYKNGSSPVSQADKEIDAFLKTSFAKERPNYGWLSEETEDDKGRLALQTVVIADPIDGTRGFIAGQNEWCISIAIAHEGHPVHCVLHCPALKRTFLASKGDGLSILEQNQTPPENRSRPLVTGSKKVIELIKQSKTDEVDVQPFIPSLAYRLALVATGELDGAFARSGASEWDIAAADLILSEAGCKFEDMHGDALIYNRENVTTPSLIASSSTHYDYILKFAKSAEILQ